MTKPIPEEPKFVKNISAFQRLIASVALTTLLMVWVCGFDFVINIFKPNFVMALTIVRVSLAISGIIEVAFVGYPQIGAMMKSILEMYEFYKKMSEIKKDKEK